jgi:hypothetical protein
MGIQMHNVMLVFAIKMAKEYNKIIKKLFNGSQKQYKKITQTPNVL